jgi:hypothetical protein
MKARREAGPSEAIAKCGRLYLGRQLPCSQLVARPEPGPPKVTSEKKSPAVGAAAGQPCLERRPPH